MVAINFLCPRTPSRSACQNSWLDGDPESWFTPNGLKGPDYQSIGNPGPGEAIYEYPNFQEAGTLWIHDHALGITRINVYAGLAGFY